MHDRMDEVEIQVAYLQNTVDELNLALCAQQREILELRRMVTLLAQKVAASAVPSDPVPQEKPPHY